MENSFVIWSVQVVGNFDKNGPRGIRGHAQTMWTAMGGGGSWNVHFTNKAYLPSKTVHEGGRGSICPKNAPHGLCMVPKIN